VGHPPEVLMPIFEDFYANDFGRLRTYTRIKPEARAIMEEVFAWLVDKFNNPSGGASSKVVV
jgi:hypothetical protein